MAQLGAATDRLMLVTTADVFEKYDNNVVFCIVGCRFSPEVLVLQWSWSLPRSMRPWGYLRLDSHGLDTVGLVNVTGVFHAAVLEKKTSVANCYCRGDCSFAAAGPRLWTDDVQSAPLLTTFRQKLKTHLLRQSYPDVVFNSFAIVVLEVSFI